MLTLIDQLDYPKFQKRMHSEIIAVLNGTYRLYYQPIKKPETKQETFDAIVSSALLGCVEDDEHDRSNMQYSRLAKQFAIQNNLLLDSFFDYG